MNEGLTGLLPPMFEQFAQFFDTSGFMPHGHCFLWFPGLLWLTVGANAAIALAYFAIPALLTYFVYRRSDIKAGSLYLVFSAFILACGVTHVVKIWNIWVPNYWVTGIVDAATAGISIAAAWLSWKVLPLAMVFPVPAQLVEKTRALEGEVARRKQTEDELLAARNEAEDILNSISDAFFAVDRDWRLTFANKRAGEIMNVDPGQMLGRSILEKFPELVGSEFHLQYQRAMDTQQVAEFDAFYPPLEKWFHVRAYPHASGLSVYFQDITAAREAVSPDARPGLRGGLRRPDPAGESGLDSDPWL
jgi:PAS domain-containing protein